MVISAGISVICVLASFSRIARVLGQPAVRIFTDYYIFMYQNVFVALKAGGRSMFAYIYPAILIAMALSLLLRAFSGRKRKKNAALPSFSEITVTVALAAFFTVFAAQTVNQTMVLSREYARFHNMTETGKKTALRGLSYVFSRFCKERLPGRHKAVLVSDFDLTRDDSRDAYPYGNLIYNLYPIDVGGITDRETDCFVVFSKKAPVIPSQLYSRFSDIHVMGNYYAIGTPKGED